MSTHPRPDAIQIRECRQSLCRFRYPVAAFPEPRAACPRCGRSMGSRSWHSYLGHLGLHGLADAYFDGDLAAAQQRLRENGLARQDPAPGNRAWPQYRAVSQGSRRT